MQNLYRRVSLVFFVAYMCVAGFLATASPAQALVDGSLYETTVTVANPVGTALTNYQAMATVDTSALVTASKLRSDCADLRVTDTDKATALSFWIESGCNTSTTKIWVKIPSLASGESRTLSFQYGGGSSTSLSSGTGTFDFFDDFSSFNASTWTGTGAYSISSGNLSVTTGSVYSDATVASQPGKMTEAKVEWTNVTGSHSGMAIADKTTTSAGNGTGAKLAYILNPNNSVVTSMADGTTNTYNILSGAQMRDPDIASPYTNWTATTSTSYIIGSAVSGSSVTVYKNRLLSMTGVGTWSAPFYIWFGGYAGSNAGTLDIGDILVDWVLVRNLAANPPVVTVGGEVTTPSEPLALAGLAGNAKVRLTWTAPSQGTSISDYIVEYQPSGGSWTVFNDGVSATVTTTVTGLTNGTSYAFRVAAVNPVATSSYSTSTTVVPVSHAYTGIFMNGQSYAVGYTGGPTLSTTQPYANIKVNAASTSLLPLIEDIDVGGDGYTGAVESPMSALANYYASLLPANSFTALMNNNAVPGAAYAALKKGTQPYTDGLAQITYAKQQADILGRGYGVDAIATLHGPADTANSAVYHTYLNEWRSDLDIDIKAITGQTNDIPMFIDQSSNFTAYGTTSSPLVSAQLKAAEENAHTYMVGPKYMFTYNTDNVHLTNESYRWFGEYLGKAIKRVVEDGATETSVRPTSVVGSGNKLAVTFTTPVAPLVFDTTLVTAKANHGFEFVDDSGSTPTITAVELSGANTVLLTLSATPVGANQKVRYAFTGTAGSKPGATEVGSARGNLRDSDTAVGLSTNTLYNWAVHFEKPVTADTSAPAISSLDVAEADTSLTVTWTTDEVADSQLEYGLLSTLGESTSVTDFATRVTSHSVTLSNLKPCSMYYLKAVSVDRLAQQTKSPLQTVSTTGCSGNAGITSHLSELADVSGSSEIDMVSDGTGVSLTAPAGYAAQSAIFQLKKLLKSSTLSGISTPVGMTSVGELFDIKPFIDSDTLLTTFLEPISIVFHFSAAEIANITNGTLGIYRHDGSSWSALTGCVTDATARTVTCQTSAFSVFGLFGQSSASTNGSSSSSSSDSSNNGAITTPTCDALPPGFKKPKIYAALARKKMLTRSIELYFTPTAHPVDHYVIEYGTKAGEYRHAVLDIQGSDPRRFTISALKPNTTYYFRVRGGNGCATGEWSDEISVKTLSWLGSRSGLFSFFPANGKSYTIGVK